MPASQHSTLYFLQADTKAHAVAMHQFVHLDPVCVSAGDMGASVFDSARLRRFSALDNEQQHPSPIMREIFDAATAQSEAADAIAAGTLRGDEYQIQAAGQLDDGHSCIKFTVRLVRLERSASNEESYKVLSAPLQPRPHTAQSRCLHSRMLAGSSVLLAYYSLSPMLCRGGCCIWRQCAG